MESQRYIKYLGSVPYMPMRSPEAEAARYLNYGELIQRDAGHLGATMERFAKLKQDEAKIQDVKNFLKFDADVNEVTLQLKDQIKASPGDYAGHGKLAQNAMEKINSMQFEFADDLSRARFESQRKKILDDINYGVATQIKDSSIADAGKNLSANAEMYAKQGNYEGLRNTIAFGRQKNLITQGEADLMNYEANREETMSIAKKDIIADPNEALKKLGNGHYTGLGEDDTYNLSQEAKKALNQKRIENGDRLLGRQFLGEVIGDGEIDDCLRKGYVNLSQAVRLKENNKARLKAIPPVYNAETYGLLDGLITDYNPDADGTGDKAGYVMNEIAASDLPDSYKKKLQERFKEKGDAIHDAEKRRVSTMKDFVRTEVDRLMNSGSLGDFKGNDLALLAGGEKFDLDASYKSTQGYEEAVMKASKITQEAEVFILSNPGADQEKVREFIGKRASDMKVEKSVDISAKKNFVPFTGGKVSAVGGRFSPEESGAALRDAVINVDMNAPSAKGSDMMNVVFAQEARRDKNGKLAVYSLPKEDGGGAYEVAGINSASHPKKAAELRAMIESGRSEEAEKEAKRYIGEVTDGVVDVLARAGVKSSPVETFLRDTLFNMGEGGMARVIQRATGAPSSNRLDESTVKALGDIVKSKGRVGAISALNEARKEHYQAITESKPEKSIFLNGWFKRSDRVASLSNGVSDYDFKGTDWESVRSGLIAEGAKNKMPIKQLRLAIGQVRQSWLVANSPFNL